jgi:predicted nucleic acid-binding protein
MPPTETTTPRVFVDTNVFYPVRVADLVLSCVDDGLLELCVSEHLLNEIERVLVEHKGLAAAKAKTFRDAVAANAIRAVHPADYEALAATLAGPDPDDLWHLAAAVAAEATVIVTENTTDFARARVPDDFTMPLIATPDQLFISLIADGLQDDLLATIARMSARLKNPPRTPSEIIEGLAACGLRATAKALRTRLAQPEEADQP